MFFSYSNSPIFDNVSYLVRNFFWINFVDLVSELYMSHYLLCNKAVILEFSYKTISIAHSLDNTQECNCIEIPEVIFWLDITKLLFHLGKTIAVFVTRCFCLWIS